MKVYYELNLKQFKFWGGAKDTVKWLSYNDMEIIQEYIEGIDGGEGISETTINDIFWFEEDWIAEILGYENFEELMEERNGL